MIIQMKNRVTSVLVLCKLLVLQNDSPNNNKINIKNIK